MITWMRMYEAPRTEALAMSAKLSFVAEIVLTHLEVRRPMRTTALP